MVDIFKPKKRSAIMAAIKGAGNLSTEKTFIKALRVNKISGWRRNSKLPGRPDIVFPKEKITIFLDGCFWHGCPKCSKTSKTRTDFWSLKIKKNKVRDLEPVMNFRTGFQRRRLGYIVRNVLKRDRSGLDSPLRGPRISS